ncbi:hypothetical protein Q95_00743 [Enterococcus faecalis EnGen0062]|nr:hypothetical protein Q95_00743 [Enterococcus faecalis EnGen0062]
MLRGTLIYIEDIEQTLNRFGRDYETFYHDRVFFNAISMCLMQIGEYTVGNSGFSEEFKEKNSGKVDWKRLRNMRNMFAHSYSTMNERQIFRMATEYIPVYKEFCLQALAELRKRQGK